MQLVQILNGKAARGVFSVSQSQFYAWQADGLMTRGIKLGVRAVGWPEHELNALAAARIRGASEDEIRALAAARIRGASEDEIRALVQDLIAARADAGKPAA